MAEYFNIKKREWQSDDLTDAEKLKQYASDNFPNVELMFKGDEIIKIGKTLNQAQKDSIKAEIITLLDA